MICCPRCWSVQAAPQVPNSVCSACRQSLSICEIEAIGGLLNVWAQQPQRLEIEATDHHQQSHVQRIDDADFKAPFQVGADAHAPSTELSIVNWDREKNAVRIERDSPGDQSLSEEFTLPCFVYHDQTLFRISAHARLAPRQTPTIAGLGKNAVRINVNAHVVIGSNSNNAIVVDHPDVESKHALVLRVYHSEEHTWIVDQNSTQGTFVNGRRVVARELHQGDIVQIGPFAWQYSARDGMLDPVDAIHGEEIQLTDVQVRKRLGPITRTINAGQLVAIVGKSGSGKTTLVKQIIRAAKGVSFDGMPACDHIVEFQNRLGYVSQQEVLHPTLKVRDALRLSKRFRTLEGLGDETETNLAVERAMRQVDLPGDRWDARVKDLSGGELRRVQLATELVNEPGLFLLDEPTSGLDPERERQTIQLLRGFSLRGGTVVVVTHGLEHLDRYDRVLQIAEGKIVYDGVPEDFPGIDFDVKLEKPSPEQDEHATVAETIQTSNESWPDSKQLESVLQQRRPFFRQFMAYLKREWLLVQGDWIRHLMFGMIVMPLFFGLSLGITVPTSESSLLGFLSVLSTIWMGASLSLMSVVGERRIVEHERQMFLTIAPYLSAKTLLLFVMSTLQTTLFFAVMHGMSAGRGIGGLQEPLSCVAILVLVGWSAVGMGLAISVLSQFSRLLANFVMPLAMIAQIVFSVQIADPNSNDDFHLLYGRFTGRQCSAHEDCRRPAAYWTATSKPGHFLCEKCWLRVRKQLGSLEQSQFELSTDEVIGASPRKVAAIASYFTISRYGDIALRTFAYNEVPAWRETDVDGARINVNAVDSLATYRLWRQYAIATLLALSIGLPFFSGLAMWVSRLDYER